MLQPLQRTRRSEPVLLCAVTDAPVHNGQAEYNPTQVLIRRAPPAATPRCARRHDGLAVLDSSRLMHRVRPHPLAEAEAESYATVHPNKPLDTPKRGSASSL